MVLGGEEVLDEVRLRILSGPLGGGCLLYTSEGDLRQRVREVSGHINVFPVARQGARTVQGQRNAGADGVQGRVIVGEEMCIRDRCRPVGARA